jgi:hypothetical protein
MSARRHRSRIAFWVRWVLAMLVLALAGAVATLIAPVAANAASPAPVNTTLSPVHTKADCTVHATSDGADPLAGITVWSTPDDCWIITTIQLWHTTSANGNPLSSQVLATNGFNGLLIGPLHGMHFLDQGGCYWQLDVAYGFAKQTLALPYGKDLVQAWHGGTRDCVTNPPTDTPAPPTTPPWTPPATTTPPTSSPAPLPSATVPPTTPAPTPTELPTLIPTARTHFTSLPTPTPSLIPPTSVSKTPSPTATHKPKPTRKPTPTPIASGCVADGCHHTTPPAPAPRTTPSTLPFTGAPTTALFWTGGILIVVGIVGCLGVAWYKRP